MTADSTVTGPGKDRKQAALSADDKALFEQAMRGVKQLPQGKPAKRRAPAKPAPASPPLNLGTGPRKPAAIAAPPKGAALIVPGVRGGAPGLDRRSELRLRGGSMPIEATLDLHHMTQAEAHAALRRFLANASAAGKRCVLVITGKGAARESGTGPAIERPIGVLKRSLPLWLEREHERVLASYPAQPKHGGGGAYYVLLRRRRP